MEPYLGCLDVVIADGKIGKDIPALSIARSGERDRSTVIFRGYGRPGNGCAGTVGYCACYGCGCCLSVKALSAQDSQKT